MEQFFSTAAIPGRWASSDFVTDLCARDREAPGEAAAEGERASMARAFSAVLPAMRHVTLRRVSNTRNA